MSISPPAQFTPLLLLLAWTFVPSSASAFVERVCDARRYGAKPDGTTKNTAAIQAAIDDCAAHGGGTVTLAGGVFLSGPIVLRDHITLNLETGTTLLGSPDHADYPAKTEFRSPGLQSLVSATNASDLAITGSGIIDGNGESWWIEARRYKDSGILGSEHTRPRLVVFNHCKHIRVEGVTLQNSPMWQLVPFASDDITIRNIRVLAPAKSPNTDAIDPFSSSNVVIDHVLADVGDDNIAIKSGAINSPGGDLPSRDIRITNCTFLHGHGLSVGSEIAGGARHITAENVTFKGTDNGLRIKANRDRGNDVSDITFRHIHMEDVKYALIVSEYYPGVLPAGEIAAEPVTRLTPHFHDILIEDVTATGAQYAGAIAGLPEAPIRNLVLRHVTIDAAKGMTLGYAEGKLEDLKLHVTTGGAITHLAGDKLLNQ